MMRLPIGISLAARGRRGSRRRPSARARGARCAPRRPARDRAQDALADHRVLAHHRPLRVVERAGLVEHLVGDRDLADVVQQRGRRDALDLDLVERRAAGDAARRGRRRTRSARRCSGRARAAPRRGPRSRRAADRCPRAGRCARGPRRPRCGRPRPPARIVQRGARPRRRAGPRSAAAPSRRRRPTRRPPRPGRPASARAPAGCARRRAAPQAASVSGSRIRNWSAPARREHVAAAQAALQQPGDDAQQVVAALAAVRLLSAPKPSMSSATSDSGRPWRRERSTSAPRRWAKA